jgi:hypothetical protein
MSKYKIKMTHTVELAVKAENEEKVWDWMSMHTPDELYSTIGHHTFDEDVICPIRNDSIVDLTIE